MWVRKKVRRWHSRSGFDKIDLYTRGTLYSLVWMTVLSQSLLSATRPVRASDAPSALIAGTILVAVAQGVCGTSLAARSLESYLGRRPVDRRLVALGAVLLFANAAGLVGLGAYAGVQEYPELQLALGASVVPFLTSFVLVVPVWASGLFQVAMAAAICGGVTLAGGDGAFAVGTLLGVGLGGALMGVTVRTSAWSLGVMSKLRDAQDVETRLAVAEERLRFGRDMHDVLGRNLAVIALKSELAVELAQRGKPAAVDQMVEVQRIARASQEEVRDVVRGYREADLSTELLGAQGVLRAAGIECAIEDGAAARARLPLPVQSGLGWVVREAATNVLRHGDPRRCVIRLRTAGDSVLLEVENDGAQKTATVSGTGSGLPGLRERLDALGGSLEAGPVGGGLFRLRASVPLRPLDRRTEAAPTDHPAPVDRPVPADHPVRADHPAPVDRPVLVEER